MLKKILIILLVASLRLNGQEIHSFKIENNHIEWQKIFESQLLKSDIEKIIKEKGIFKNITFEEELLDGEIENISPDYQGAGKSSWNTSFYVQNSSISGTFHIDFKDGRYRVTLNGINLKTINDLSGNGISVMTANSVQPLSDFAIKKGEFKKGFLKADAQIFEITFSNLFDFDKYELKSEDW
ncbi:hypothetical protein [Sediminicola sp. 1XM1-17]|uniref:hypothetical protein n=1 Tax=Sediminicola sp. 1XM1-17 TaxID=3127702 RepID=UPI00307874CF